MTERGERKGKVGYRRPPAGHRYPPGQSGNPNGRPKGRRSELPYESVLGRMVIIRDGGVERSAPADAAFLLYMAKRGMERGGATSRVMLAAIEKAKADGFVGNRMPVAHITRVIVGPGVTIALEPLRMARKLDRYRETARMMLEPWLVEMALARLGDRRLTIEEQKEVAGATRTPRKVRWPDWWGT